jgi:LysM domain
MTRTDQRCRGRREVSAMRRVVRGLLALVALLAGVVGVPAALVALGGNPLPDRSSWAAVARALLRPDDGTVLIGLVTVVGWIAWVVFAVSVVAELAGAVSGYRFRLRLPGLGAPQRLAASLIIAVLTLTMTPQVSHAEPFQGPVLTGTPLAPAIPEARPAPRIDPAVTRQATVQRHADRDVLIHEVQAGDDLWSLAEQYYGAGREWRKIAAANSHILSGGPDRLEPGWRLEVPGVKAPDHEAGTATVTVRRGDTLTSIADRELGDGSRWRELFHANRAVLSDPDELAVGMTLTVPSAAGKHVAIVDEKPASKSEHKPLARERPDPPADPHQNEHQQPPHTDTAPPVTPSEVPVPEAPASQRESEQAQTLDPVVLGIASVGGLLAAGLLAGLAARRRVQLQARPLGRRITHPPRATQVVETALGARQLPMGLRTLDLALRAISAHCLQSDSPLPRLSLAAVGDGRLELTLSEPSVDAPIGFSADGRTWWVDRSGAKYLKTVPGVSTAVRPYPALVTLGADNDGRQVLADLEAVGLLTLDASPDEAAATLAAMAVELSFSPWADEMILTLVGACPGLPDALGKHNVTRMADVDAVLNRLESRAEMQRAHRPDGPPGHHRIDPDLADPWAPEIVLVNQSLSPEQGQRLVDLLTSEPRATMAAVVAGPVTGAPWSLVFDRGAADRTADRPGDRTARLEPAGLRLTPQRIDRSAEVALVSLVAATGSDVTTPAPWWDHPDPSMDNVTYLGRRFGGWGPNNNEGPNNPATNEGGPNTDTEGDETMDEPRMVTDRRHHHPVLQILGPVDLVGAMGELPPRASKQCLEYCGWLLQNPGTTAQAMASALIVAEGTRRSNMSRLRTWLGANAGGEPYLPDAYSGHIALHPTVSSDWQRLQILTAAGVNRTSDSGLRAALDLVRGAPLADAAPGQWHWAEELRTDMISAVRDIGVEFANRALDSGDLDLARWSAARALVAAPGDELLMTVRIRTEHQAGNDADTERLTLQLAAQARSLGVDLDPGTVELLQQVMEGRVRARLA